MKESNTIKSLFAKDRGMPKGANYPAAFEKKAFEKGKKFKNLFKGITVSGVASKLPKAAKNLGKVATVSRIARAATPIGLAASAAKVVYDVATMSPEKKAKVKKLKSTLSKTSTKDYHSDLLKMSTGGDTMLKKIPEGPKGEGLRKLKAERPDVTKKMGFAKNNCPNTEKFYNNMISFPFHVWMSDKEFNYLISSVKKALKSLRNIL